VRGGSDAEAAAGGFGGGGGGGGFAGDVALGGAGLGAGEAGGAAAGGLVVFFLGLFGGEPVDVFAFDLAEGHVAFVGIPHAQAVRDDGDLLAAGEQAEHGGAHGPLEGGARDEEDFGGGFGEEAVEARAFEEIEVGEVEDELLNGAEAVDWEAGAAVEGPFLAAAEIGEGHFLVAGGGGIADQFASASAVVHVTAADAGGDEGVEAGGDDGDAVTAGEGEEAFEGVDEPVRLKKGISTVRSEQIALRIEVKNDRSRDG